MATNTAALKTFAQQTRAKLISLITTKMQFVLNADTAELRGYERQIGELRKKIAEKSEKEVIEEIAYTWFNRVMALRFMDANGYNAPMIVTPAPGQTRPEILQDAMGGSIDDALMLTSEEKLLPEAKLYRKLLVAVCNKQMSTPMPFLFEHISDYTELLLPDDLLSDQSFVSDIRNGMTDEDCQNVELMGWLYQFYITDRKADAETKKSKKGGLKSDEQAAATQLFTPHWIVRYMVENSLGRIWMTLHPDSALINDMPYYIATPEGQTDTIPEDIHSVRDIRFIDPCMGSGHILVYAFDLLTKMYEEEGEQSKDIPTLILENNLYGIDIDRRCYQLASFALTMKARAYYRRYLRKTVNPHVIALEKIDKDTIESAGSWRQKSLMWQFENIDTIGSLLKVTPEECAAIHVDEGSLFGTRQQLMKTQAEYLSQKYHCVVTNPPYLGKGMGDALTDYIKAYYPESKADTMATFMERNLDFCLKDAKTSMINMQSWMFLPTYEDLRQIVLNNTQIDSLLSLGAHAFDEISGEIVRSATFVIANRKPDSNGLYYGLTEGNCCADKERKFLDDKNDYRLVNQKQFSKIPGSPISFEISDAVYENFDFPKMGTLCLSNGQNITGDNDRFLRFLWEVDQNDVNSSKWVFCARGGGFRKYYGNVETLILWTDEARDYYHKDKIARIISKELRFKNGITWSYVCSGRPTFRHLHSNELFEKAGTSVFLKDESHLYDVLGLLNSKPALYIYHKIQPATVFQVRDMFLLPIRPQAICGAYTQIIKDNINISHLDWDAHETSWDFRRNPLYEQFLECMYDDLQNVVPAEATLDNLLQYAVPEANHPLSTCMKNYKDTWEMNFMRLHSNEEELNRKFIEIYGLQDELTPDVPLDEVTILQKGEISIEDNKIVWHDDVIIKQFISYLIGCFMGRYSVNKPGLIIASQGQKVENLDLPEQTLEIDDDGIIPVIQEEDFFTDDLTQRIEDAVKTVFGEQNFYDNMKFIKTALGMNLRDYLYKNFYADHQQMYSVKGAKRPIYWLFSSQMGDKKKKGYFKALVYMHRMEADTLSKLHADYVHPYLQKIEQQLVEAEDNATRDDLSQTQHNKALKVAEELREKVREVKTFETALVEMASARITIDLDDGVKANYPKFYPLVEPIKGLEASDD